MNSDDGKKPLRGRHAPGIEDVFPDFDSNDWKAAPDPDPRDLAEAARRDHLKLDEGKKQLAKKRAAAKKARQARNKARARRDGRR